MTTMLLFLGKAEGLGSSMTVGREAPRDPKKSMQPPRPFVYNNSRKIAETSGYYRWIAATRDYRNCKC
jgi:hypothetical protein